MSSPRKEKKEKEKGDNVPKTTQKRVEGIGWIAHVQVYMDIFVH